MIETVITAGAVLAVQPIIYFIICGAISISKDLSENARNEIIYSACKFLKYNHVVGWVSVISGCIFVFFGLFILLYSTPIATYSESDYNVEAMAKDLILLTDENSTYELVSHDLFYSPTNEKCICISYFPYLDKYRIGCYGIDSMDLSGDEIRNISSKYKKGAN